MAMRGMQYTRPIIWPGIILELSPFSISVVLKKLKSNLFKIHSFQGREEGNL